MKREDEMGTSRSVTWQIDRLRLMNEIVLEAAAVELRAAAFGIAAAVREMRPSASFVTLGPSGWDDGLVVVTPRIPRAARRNCPPTRSSMTPMVRCPSPSRMPGTSRWGSRGSSSQFPPCHCTRVRLCCTPWTSTGRSPSSPPRPPIAEILSRAPVTHLRHRGDSGFRCPRRGRLPHRTVHCQRLHPPHLGPVGSPP